MKRLTGVAAAILVVLRVFAQSPQPQRELLKDMPEWCEGSILLTDGKEWKGFVRYSTWSGKLSFHQGDESQSFSPDDVVAFEFFDELLQQQRVFYSFPRANAGQYFEVLDEFKEFSVLSQVDPVSIYEHISPMTQPSPRTETASNLRASQSETIYIMNKNGNIQPYFCTTKEQKLMMSSLFGESSKTRSNVIDKDLLEEYIEPEYYVLLKTYARNNSLSFRDKADFLRILQYYKEQIGAQ